MRNCFYICLLTLGAVSYAGPMDELDAFIGCKSLSESFRHGDEVAFNNESCLGTSCDSFRTTSQIVFESSNRIVIRSIDAYGKVFQEEGLTSDRWAQVHCNRARLHLEGMETSGFQVHISKVRRAYRDVTVNGQSMTVETRAVDIQGSNRLGFKIDHTLEVAANVGGLAQLLVREQRSGNAGIDRFSVETVKY